jgi:pyridoxal phosphate enzyme (YggS family)
MLSTPQNSSTGQTLGAHLAALQLRIRTGCAAAHRDVRSVTLLAVSKGQDVARIQAALALGLTQFGENYVAEALPKIRALRASAAQWHFIGRLQANKTRAIAEHFSWVHSIDRLRIAERLAAQRPHHAPPLNVCVQVHVANDPDKGGIAPANTLALLQAVAALPHLQLRGLMCMLPFGSAVPAQRAGFACLRELLESGRRAGLPLDTLSMGMSDDLEAALAEGATLVRVGTALFGPRDDRSAVESPP